MACSDTNNSDQAYTLFKQLPSSETGISFNNAVTDSSNFNIFNYRNFYNGAGVGIGDINNDGLPDIFFTSNQGTNHLYLNKGNWKFEDISARAGIQGIHKWHTGVAMADVNGDGWLDIYVSNSGDIKGNNRQNELYINLHNETFSEQAGAYGLDDKGIGTQAAFFDYDKDGDLDCFVLNNSFRPIESFGFDRRVRHIRSESGGHRLYQNDNNHFYDVSDKAGIYGSEIGFGLGVSVGDVNNDSWADIYVSNDFFEKDYLYINQGNGSFKENIEEATGHVSLASMGSDIADINNDGFLDIFTTDMLPESDYRLKTTTRFDDYDVNNAKLRNDFHHQLEKNCLQLNNGDGTFSEIADMAGVMATDWSWGALSFDFDNDGWKDIFVSNGISKDLTDQDFLNYFGNDATRQQVLKEGFEYKSFLDKMPVTPVSNYAFLNKKDLTFENKSAEFGLGTPSFSNGAAYGDLDGDGDLDLVVNNENQPAFVYRNMVSESDAAHFLKVILKGNTANTAGIGSRVIVYAAGTEQVQELMPSRGFQSSVEPVLNFGVGKVVHIDSLLVQWPDNRYQVLYNITADTSLILNQSEASSSGKPSAEEHQALYADVTNAVISGNIDHRENNFIDFDREKLIPKMLSAEGPRLTVADVNADGLEDFFIGGAAGDTGKIFIQTSSGRFIQTRQYALIQDYEYEDAGAEFFDADGDGDWDLVVASGGNEHANASLNLLTRLYLNDGKGNFSRALNGWPVVPLNASCVRVGDMDNNGRPDVFIGGRSIPGAYGKRPSSVLLKNMGKGRFADVTATVSPELLTLGMVTDAHWADFNNDGKQELGITGDWMPLCIFSFNNGYLRKVKEVTNSSGWWNCLSIADINHDGKVDIIAANNGLNSKVRADKEHPASLYVNDFDGNGSVECVPVYYKSDGKAYPFNLYGEMVSQMPSLRRKFSKYSQYAGAPVEEVFSAKQLKTAEKLIVKETQTGIFLNDGKGNFSFEPLPQRAQMAPVYAVLAMDMDTDAKTDLVLGGNFYGLKPEVGRYDASYGVSLFNKGAGNFVYKAPSTTGLFFKGEIRDIKKIRTPKGDYILVARNNEPLQIFSRTK